MIVRLQESVRRECGYWMPALIVCAFVLLSGTAYADKDTPDDVKLSREERRASQVRDDIETMSGVIGRILAKRLPGHFEEGNLFREGVQGWHVKDVGAFFNCTVNFDVTDPPPKPEPEEEKDPGDLWEEVELSKSEDSGGGAAVADAYTFYGGQHAFGGENTAPGWVRETDRSELVERLDEAILEAIHTYGSRIQDLPRNESIVVTVFGGGQGSGNPLQTFIIGSTPKGDAFSTGVLVPPQAPGTPSNEAVPVDVPVAVSVVGTLESSSSEDVDVDLELAEQEEEIEAALQEAEERVDEMLDETVTLPSNENSSGRDSRSWRRYRRDVEELASRVRRDSDRALREAQNALRQSQTRMRDAAKKMEKSKSLFSFSGSAFGWPGKGNRSVRTYQVESGDFKPEGTFEQQRGKTMIYAYK